jgi:hypothetical protein
MPDLAFSLSEAQRALGADTVAVILASVAEAAKREVTVRVQRLDDGRFVVETSTRLHVKTPAPEQEPAGV